MKFIYWFAYHSPDAASVRYRGKYPLDYLREKFGIKSYFITPGYKPIKIIQFLRAYCSALFFRKKESLIVVQRIHSGFIYANLLRLLIKARKTNTVYDLDDADYLEHPEKMIYWFAKNCAMVSVGSHELRKNLSKLNKSIILNTSPTPDLTINKKNKNKILTIGWIGCFGGGHKESLINDFFPALSDLPFKVKIVLMGVTKKKDFEFLTNYFSKIANVHLEILLDTDWHDERSIQQQIATFDIGIATLFDDEFHRSKSAFKAKQYLNNGVPVLSSNVPENNYFVKHGKNGFLCSTPEEFRRRIIEIREMDEVSFLALSKNAKHTSRQFDLDQYCEKIIDTYKHAHSNK
jgi:glycosyltransferase involved in cell wall biosynthesis